MPPFLRPLAAALRTRRALAILCLTWATFVAAGLGALWKEEFTPAPASSSPDRFPAGTQISLAADRPTLVVFAHPHCPCTRATFHELSRILDSRSQAPRLTVVFALPAGAPAGWEQGELLDEAKRFPEATLILDRGEAEARRFQVNGSGATLLYSGEGRLLFSGGITPSRGHEGDNPGRDAIISLVRFGQAPLARSAVYGCPLSEEPAL